MSNKITFFLKSIFDLREDCESEEKILVSVKHNVRFKGGSLWVLIFAILLASVGLNINSTAIVIGAMLISPLMGPIVGLGLSLGINDFTLLRRSIKNLSIATIISILVSTIYFYISPINTAQSELLGRISPTIYDVLIAFFGGLAGIVASTRKEKGNVIPGVAIATALMPPLCTVGYGVATGQLSFILGAFYLYTINCIFICLATLIGVKYFKLHSVSFVSEKYRIKTKRIITSIVIIILIPAIYLGFNFVKENDFNQNVNRYIEKTFTENGYAVIYKKIDIKSKPHKIELAILAKNFTPEEIDALKLYLGEYNLKNTELIIRQNENSLTSDQWNNVLNNIKDESEKVKILEAKLLNTFINSVPTTQILKEAQVINSKVSNLAIGPMSFSNDAVDTTLVSSSTDSNIQTVLLYTNSSKITTEEKELLTKWLKSRLQNESVVIIFQ